MNIFKSKKIHKYAPIVFFVSFFILFMIISFFRDAQRDENIYMGDAAVIADLLKQGKWIGNYGVGLHGFLSKLLVGIIFIFTGPSVFVATTFNIIIGILSGVVFFRILRKNFSLNLGISLAGTAMLFCSYQFLTYVPTFYRDIGALLFVLLFVQSILDKKNLWIGGFFLMMILDSKEHVFYTLAPAVVIWIGVISWKNSRNKKRKILEGARMFITNSLLLFLPSLIYLILMFATPVIPMNIYNANILGLIDEGLNPLVVNFDPQYATINRDIANNPDIAVAPSIAVSNSNSAFLNYVIKVINVLLSYVGKVSYPRTFSYISIPFIVAVPAIWVSVQYLRKWHQKKENEKILLPILMYFYLLIYVIHASISRYILPISPVLILFFFLFLRDLDDKDIGFVRTYLVTLGFVSLGLLFEYSYILIKVVFSFLVLGIIWWITVVKNKSKNTVKYVVILLISMFTAGASLLASYINGQIGASLVYGYNRECEEIMDLVEGDTIWINDIGWDRLPYILRSENVQNPEWRWALQEWIPKKSMLIVPEDYSTYSFRWRNEILFKETVEERKIDTIMYIDVTKDFKYDTLYMQERLSQVNSFGWLKLRETKKLKNKIVYIFDVTSL